GLACPDDGNPCTGDWCDGNGGCTHVNQPENAPCDDGNACTVSTTCTSGLCGGGSPAAAGTSCRGKAGECDVAEYCDGAGTSCPPNGHLAVGTVCSTGTCDSAGTCSGSCTPTAEICNGLDDDC